MKLTWHKPPYPAIFLSIGLVLLFAFSALVAQSDPPDVPRNSYPLIIPQDGVVWLRDLVSMTMVFLSGALFAFACLDVSSLRGLAMVGALLPWMLRLELSDDWVAPVALLTAVLALEWVYQRIGLAPKWWLSVRVPTNIAIYGCLIWGLS